MPEPDLVALFAGPLHRSGARYLVAGSVGAMVYSEPRLTIDIDLAVALDEAALAALPSLFPEPDIRRMIELSSDLIDRRILADELERRGLLEHFRGMTQAGGHIAEG